MVEGKKECPVLTEAQNPELILSLNDPVRILAFVVLDRGRGDCGVFFRRSVGRLHISLLLLSPQPIPPLVPITLLYRGHVRREEPRQSERFVSWARCRLRGDREEGEGLLLLVQGRFLACALEGEGDCELGGGFGTLLDRHLMSVVWWARFVNVRMDVKSTEGCMGRYVVGASRCESKRGTEDGGSKLNERE